MPVMGLGTWQLTKDTAGTVAAALKLGCRMIDTSGDYGTQPGIAEGIVGSGIPREDIYIVTKVEEDEDAYEAVRHNLDELQIEYADLILIHRPPAKGVGEELWQGLQRSRSESLVRDIGVSNYSKEQIEELLALTGEGPAVNQIEWSPFGHSESMLEYAKERGMVIQAYSPLTRAKRLDETALIEMATAHSKSPAQIMVRWALQKGVVPIPKANQHDHLEEILDVFDFELSPADMERLDNCNEQYSALGKLQYIEE